MKTHVVCVRTPYCNARRSTFHVVRMAVWSVRHGLCDLFVTDCVLGENSRRWDESPGESFADAVARGVRRVKRKKTLPPGLMRSLTGKSISVLNRANGIPRISLRDRRKIRVLDHADTPTGVPAKSQTTSLLFGRNFSAKTRLQRRFSDRRGRQSFVSYTCSVVSVHIGGSIVASVLPVSFKTVLTVRDRTSLGRSKSFTWKSHVKVRLALSSDFGTPVDDLQ